MSNIEQNLQKILSSRYGKDVRQSIHDGIHDCYEDGKAGAVDLVAREQIANLVANNNPTDGNSELLDIRVGADGRTYKSAGEAVRGQIGSLSEEIDNFKNGIGKTITNRGKNLLFLKDKRYESNGLTLDIQDQLITISGKVDSTAIHNYFELDVDMPELLNGEYGILSIVTDQQSISGRNDVLKLRFFNSLDEKMAEKSAFNHQSLTGVSFDNLENYKVQLVIPAQYTYKNEWSFNLQLAIKGVDYPYEKAYVDRKFELYLGEKVDENKSEIENIKRSIGLSDETNPLSKIITDSGMTGLIESYACPGDSLTQGVFDRTNGAAMDFEATKYYSYPSQFSRITGSKVYNLGNAGATACNSQQAMTDYHSWLQTATQKNWFSDSFKAKAYIISLGTNDIGYYGSFTGNVETDIDVDDYNNNDTTTSVGGLATIIQKARELQPKAIIFVETIDNTRNAKSTRDEANEKIRLIAKKLDCYVIDMAKYWISEEEATEWKLKYQNGGHLNALGYLLKTQARITYIDWIIRNNLESFRNVQFIGTDMDYVK